MIGGLEHFLARRRPPPTVPSMEGALRPNQALDEARLLAWVAAPDNLAWQDHHLLLSSGNEIQIVGDVNGGEVVPEPILSFDQPVSALASGVDGALAVGLGRAGVCIVGGAHDGARVTELAGRPLICPTALAFLEPEVLLLCQGSAHHPPEDWQRDLLGARTTGSVWRVELGSGRAQCLGENLGFPNGILLLDGGARIAVSESSRHRLLAFETGRQAAPTVLLDDLPGYPGRLGPAAGEGAWLAVFAPRSELVELVLREDAFRNWMMREIEPAFWIAPSLRSGHFAEAPMRGRAAKALGLFDPTVPVRSYGLAVRLDRNFTPVASLHSQADGKRHGVTSCLEMAGALLIACKGDDVLIAADTAGEGEG